MNEEERGWIVETFTTDRRPPIRSMEELPSLFGVEDGAVLGRMLLQRAVEDRDAGDVGLSLVVCWHFGVTRELLPLLIELAFADWHHRQEEVTSQLDELAAPESVEALVHMARHRPSYFDYDDGEALSSKAIYALRKIPGEAAERALVDLLDSDRELIRSWARHCLDLRHEEGVV